MFCVNTVGLYVNVPGAVNVRLGVHGSVTCSVIGLEVYTLPPLAVPFSYTVNDPMVEVSNFIVF